MDFTPGEIVAIITAIGIVVVNIITAYRVADVKAELGHVSKSVNSAASAQVAKIEHLQAEMTRLRGEMAERKETAAVLAASTASAAVASALPTAEHSLQSIDDNTKAIEENTAKTEVVVQDIQDKQRKRP